MPLSRFRLHLLPCVLLLAALMGACSSSAPPDVPPPSEPPAARPPGAPTQVLATAEVRAALLSWTPPVETGGASSLSYSVTVEPASASANVLLTGKTGARVE